MFIEHARINEKPTIHDVKSDFWKLRDLYENYSIRDFDTEFMRISDAYLGSDFNPDNYFPNKVELRERLDAIINELRTVQLLASKKVDSSEYIDNVSVAIALCLGIKGMKWVKEDPKWTITTDEIRIVDGGDI